MDTTENIREPRRLTRPKDGRYIGGVAAGLGAYFDLSPAIYRIAFVALALAGGTGIVLYLAAWAVIPEEGRDESVASEALQKHRDHPSRVVGLAVLAFAVVIVLSSAHFWPNPANLWLAAVLVVCALVWQLGSRSGDRGGKLLPITVGALLAVTGAISILDASGAISVDWRIVLGALVVVTGSLVVVGATTGRAVGAVAFLGIVFLAALAVAVLVRIPLFSGIGDRVERPATIASLDRKYELGIGDFTVDLSNVRLPLGKTEVETTLGIGDLRVEVPSDVTVVVDAHISGGDVTVFERHESGTSADIETTDVGTDPSRVLVLDANVGLGQLDVVRP